MNSTEKQKEYTLTFEQREGFLAAYIYAAKDTLAISQAYWGEIVEKVITGKHHRLLVVEDIPDAISIAEAHQLVSDFAELPMIDVKIAFVDKHPDQKNLNEFAILVGANRGMTIQAFEDESEAEAWLISDTV